MVTSFRSVSSEGIPSQLRTRSRRKLTKKSAKPVIRAGLHSSAVSHPDRRFFELMGILQRLNCSRSIARFFRDGLDRERKELAGSVKVRGHFCSRRKGGREHAGSPGFREDLLGDGTCG